MNEQPASTPEQRLLADTRTSGGIDVLAVLMSLARSKGIILGSAILCASLVWLFLLRAQPTFLATTEILPPNIARGSVAASLLSQSAASSDATFGGFGAVMQAKNGSDTFVVILSAWPIQDALVKQFDLVHTWNARDVADARGMLASRTVLKATKEGFINIGIIDTDRKRSADLANAYVEQARQFLRGLALSEASQRRLFYENQLAKTKEDLTQAEVAFQKLQQSSGMISLDAQARTLLETAATLRSQITAREVQLESLRGYSTESNPQVQIAETELKALRGQLAQLESQGQGGYSGKALRSVPGAEVDFVRATRELKYQEALYDLMVKQYEGSRIDESRDAPVIQVIEPALVPDHKFGPRKVRDMRYAFGGGLVLGVLIALFRHWRASVTAEQRIRLGALRRAIFRW